MILTGPTSVGVEASDETQMKEAKDNHDKLMTKLEVLEERVEKLESENQELKKESEKLAAQASDNKQDAEVKATESVVKKEEVDGKDVKNEAVETSKVVPKGNDDSLTRGDELGKDTTDTAIHKQPVDSVKSNPHVNSKLTQKHEEQLLSQDDTKKLHSDPLKEEVGKTVDVFDNKNSKDVQQEGNQIPALAVVKDTDLTLGHQAPDSQKLHLEDEAVNTQKHQDMLLEKPAVKLNGELDLPHVDQNSEEKIPADQIKLKSKITKRSRSVDDDLQNLEEKVPKLDTADVGVLSRDLLHNSKQDAKLAKNTSTMQDDKVSDSSQTTAPIPTQKENTTKTVNALKRDILSLKFTNDNETESLSDG